ncbi:pectinesterase family protein [Microbulbifer sp. SAOS-129_SWC]|uniref:pectinesterase family protein n=1 Tax=Microbulbifer sp. SAOS-129_SWC TaxID=3145235 RepID=UPI003216F3E6
MRALITFALLLTTRLALAAPEYSALVDPAAKRTANVYHSIAAALAQAPVKGERPYVIYVRNGRYREKLTVDKPNITLLGESRAGTVISYDAFAGEIMPGSAEKWGTFRSATLTVLAPGFRAEDLTIENDFDFLGNDALDKMATEKVGGTQAVALAINGAADRSAFRNVKLSGYQDTLYSNSGRSYFLNSVIQGNVDFIFGAGTVLFERSDIINRARARQMETTGYVTAPSTDIGNPYGLVFLHCRLLKEPGVPAGSVPLGRPWHPTTTFDNGRYADPNAIGASVFIDTYMDDHIASDGWASMRGTSRDGTKRTVFKPADSRFFEYQSRGPGAAINADRRQLAGDKAALYTRDRVLRGWEPAFAQD